MRIQGAVAALVLTFSACRKPTPAPLAQGQLAGVDGGQRLTPVVLTAQKVQAFVVLQRKELGLNARALERLSSTGANPALYAVLKARQAEDARVRKESGLRGEELRFLEQVTADVVAKRAFARSFNFAPQLAQVESLKERLPEDQRAALEATVGKLKVEEADFTALSAERAKYGSVNVDRVLEQEDALTDNFNRGLVLMGGRKLPRAH